jgi:hypothetical protein
LLLLITILKEKPSNDVLLDGTGSYVVKPVMNTKEWEYVLKQ